MSHDFIKEWHFVHTLGEGAYGEVRLLMNRDTQETVAVKVIDNSKFPNAYDSVKKEICIHQKLNHENIIKFLGHRRENKLEYIFIEYASGGELFDKIEPDYGMEMSSAHRFFIQLISGVEYLHQKGIVHRDIKPENLLLDDHDNIKISDFGMSTLFRHCGNERLLSQKCGTPPYMAPEIFINKEYRAEPTDIWSCGVVLVALLAGELPWDRPTIDFPSYRDWKECKIMNSPWTKIDNLVLSLLRKMLIPNASKRYKLTEIKNHQWFTKKFQRDASIIRNNLFQSPKCKRVCNNNRNAIPSATQPVESDVNLQSSDLNDAIRRGSFSQPAHIDNMILNTQMQSSPVSKSQNMHQRLVRRMTRFFTNVNAKKTMIELKQLFDTLNYQWKKCGPGQITITTIDKRRMTLMFKASVIEMNSHQVLVDFRLSRGDGIEFKRHFIQIRNNLNSIITKGPITWPLAIATNSLP